MYWALSSGDFPVFAPYHRHPATLCYACRWCHHCLLYWLWLAKLPGSGFHQFWKKLSTAISLSNLSLFLLTLVFWIHVVVLSLQAVLPINSLVESYFQVLNLVACLSSLFCFLYIFQHIKHTVSESVFLMTLLFWGLTLLTDFPTHCVLFFCFLEV